jgi:hypothetical protein
MMTADERRDTPQVRITANIDDEDIVFKMSLVSGLLECICRVGIPYVPTREEEADGERADEEATVRVFALDGRKVQTIPCRVQSPRNDPERRLIVMNFTLLGQPLVAIITVPLSIDDETVPVFVKQSYLPARVVERFLENSNGTKEHA